MDWGAVFRLSASRFSVSLGVISPFGESCLCFIGHRFAFRRLTFFCFRQEHFVPPDSLRSGSLFRLSASDFLCFAKESNQRKATPEGTALPLRYRAALRCSRPSAPAELAVALRTTAQTVLGDTPSGRCASRRPQRGPQKQTHHTNIPRWRMPLHPIGFDLPVLGPLKRRRGAELRTGAVGEDCLSPDRLYRSGRVPQPPGRGEHRRAFRSDAEERCAGVPFSLATFFWASKRKWLAREGEMITTETRKALADWRNAVHPQSITNDTRLDNRHSNPTGALPWPA